MIVTTEDKKNVFLGVLAARSKTSSEKECWRFFVCSIPGGYRRSISGDSRTLPPKRKILIRSRAILDLCTDNEQIV